MGHVRLHDLHHDGVGLLSENSTENVVEFNLNQFNETTPTAVAGSSLTSIEKVSNLQNNDEWYKGKIKSRMVIASSSVLIRIEEEIW